MMTMWIVLRLMKNGVDDDNDFDFHDVDDDDVKKDSVDDDGGNDDNDDNNEFAGVCSSYFQS